MLKLCLLFALLPPVMAGELQIFAAASLTQALREIGTNYLKATGDQLRFNFGASSLLARQIEMGAPADIFFSADDDKMDYLQQRGLIVNDTRKTPLSNQLVLVAAKGSKIASPRDLLNVSRIALAETKTVPAGIYAKKYLETIGLWSEVVSKVIPTENVRGALSAVEAGNADVAIVYQTDAAISQKVRVAYVVPREETPEIRYPIAVVKATADLARAKDAVGYLTSSGATDVYRKYGFIILK